MHQGFTPGVYGRPESASDSTTPWFKQDLYTDLDRALDDNQGTTIADVEAAAEIMVRMAGPIGLAFNERVMERTGLGTVAEYFEDRPWPAWKIF
jgi:hypothetical protein